VQKETATFLVREKSFNAKAFGIQPTRLLGGSQVGHQIQRVFIAFGPTTDEHHRTIRFLGKEHLRAVDKRARLDTPSHGIEAKAGIMASATPATSGRDTYTAAPEDSVVLTGFGRVINLYLFIF